MYKDLRNVMQTGTSNVYYMPNKLTETFFFNAEAIAQRYLLQSCGEEEGEGSLIVYRQDS